MDLDKIPFVVSFVTQASAGIKYGVPRFKIESDDRIEDTIQALGL